MLWIALLVTLILFPCVIFVYLQRRPLPDPTIAAPLPGIETAAVPPAAFPDGLIARMISANRKCVIFYGSQTGTAEEYAVRLAKDLEQVGLASQVADPEAYDMSELLDFPSQWLALFILSTYGEGEPTDNVRQFYEWLTSESSPEPVLSHLHYSLFGLGNKTYEQYNAVAKCVDGKFQELGAHRIGELGLGDDHECLEEDFIAWRESCWPLMCSFLGVDPNACLLPMIRSYTLQEESEVEPFSSDMVFTGEVTLLRSKFQNKARKIYDAHVPYEAIVDSCRLLGRGDENQVYEAVVDLGDSGIHYSVGDHLGVFPRNAPELVEAYAARLGLSTKLDTVFHMTAKDSTFSKKTPFPCPTSYRTALACYLDLTTPPKSHILKAMAEYCSDETTRVFLLHFTKASGREDYQSYIHASRRTVLELLCEFPAIQIPADHLFELLPRMQCRYYSVSSSPRTCPTKVHLTIARLDYATLTDRHALGVASNWLWRLGSATKESTEASLPRLPVFVRKSIFKLPRNPLKPIIMVGPGTGLAPFIGFLADRTFHKQRGAEVGPAILFFGCRRSDQDFIYQHELEQFLALGTLTRLETAFSRDQSEKMYVQHKMLANASFLYELIHSEGAYIYVCGDAKNMAVDVGHAFETIVQQFSGSCSSREQACAYVKKLKGSGRYLEDVWS